MASYKYFYYIVSITIITIIYDINLLIRKKSMTLLLMIDIVRHNKGILEFFFENSCFSSSFIFQSQILF